MFLNSMLFQNLRRPSASGQGLLCNCFVSFTFELALRFNFFENPLVLLVFLRSSSFRSPLKTRIPSCTSAILDSHFQTKLDQASLHFYNQQRTTTSFWDCEVVHLPPYTVSILIAGQLFARTFWPQSQTINWENNNNKKITEKLIRPIEMWGFTWLALRRLSSCASMITWSL